MDTSGIVTAMEAMDDALVQRAWAGEEASEVSEVEYLTDNEMHFEPPPSPPPTRLQRFRRAVFSVSTIYLIIFLGTIMISSVLYKKISILLPSYPWLLGQLPNLCKYTLFYPYTHKITRLLTLLHSFFLLLYNRLSSCATRAMGSSTLVCTRGVSTFTHPTTTQALVSRNKARFILLCFNGLHLLFVSGAITFGQFRRRSLSFSLCTSWPTQHSNRYDHLLCLVQSAILMGALSRSSDYPRRNRLIHC